MAKKFHNSAFPKGETNYGMPMGSKITDMGQQPHFENKAEQPGMESIDRAIAADVAKLKSQMNNRK